MFNLVLFGNKGFLKKYEKFELKKNIYIYFFVCHFCWKNIVQYVEITKFLRVFTVLESHLALKTSLSG